MEFLNNLPPWITTVIALSGGMFGLIGTVLGIANFYMRVSERRIYIRLMPFMAFRVGHDNFFQVRVNAAEKLARLFEQYGLPVAAIEVINLSKFAIVVDEVGFCYSLPDKGERAPFIKPYIIPDLTSPFRLEPRAALTAYAVGITITSLREGMNVAYVKTSCDTTKTIKSKSFVKNMKYLRACKI
jgi:hypothetical protein